MFHHAGLTQENARNDLYDAPVESFEQQIQITDQNNLEVLNNERGKSNTALALLATAYGSSSDSEDDQGNSDNAVDGDDLNIVKHPPASKSREMSCLASTSIDNYEYYMHKRVERIMSPFDTSVKSEDYDITSGVALKHSRAGPHSTLNSSQDTCAETPLLGKTVIPVEHKNVPLAPPCDDDSFRMHVFCLEHAAEAEEQLRPIGGADILLLCHPGLVINLFTTC